MAKHKESKDSEFYKGKIRELEKLIKALRKHIRQLEKQRHQWEKQSDDEYEEIPVEVTTKIDCPKCFKGSLAFSDLGIKILKVCNTCGWRKTENK